MARAAQRTLRQSGDLKIARFARFIYSPAAELKALGRPNHTVLLLIALLPISRIAQRLSLHRTCIIAFFAVYTLISQTADGQQRESAAVGLRIRPDTLAPVLTLSPSHAATDTADRRSRVAHDIRVGVIAGAAVGVVAAVISTSNNTNHSYDVFAYAVYTSIGALVGLTAGAIVGSIRGP